MMRAARLCAMLVALWPELAADPWPRHAIDNSSRGADGVRLADVNRAGFADIVIGWEEGGVIRVYIHPEPLAVRRPWPAVTVGRVRWPEDAVFADLDGDGATDVISSSEGAERAIYVHWAPKNPDRYLDEAAWRTEPLLPARGRMQWMFALPLEIDFRRGIDLVAGGKNEGAQIGCFEAPAEPRDLAAWQWRPLRPAGWVMSLIPSDMDADGDTDLLVSDRKSPASGAFWLENPGPGPSPAQPWPEHPIGAAGEEVMFLAEADLDGDGLRDVLAAVRPRGLRIFRRLARDGRAWEQVKLRLPETASQAKAVQAGDLDLDGVPDIVFSCEHAGGGRSGVMWLSRKRGLSDWEGHDISGPDGVKFDLVELIDLDRDGDLDVLTCEETDNLGVIWYENPAR